MNEMKQESCEAGENDWLRSDESAKYKITILDSLLGLNHLYSFDNLNEY
jgi:hypothetical protein